MIGKIERMLEAEEAIRGQPYDDATGKRIRAPKGKVTIGIGRNLDANPLTRDEAMYLLRNDIRECLEVAAELFPHFETWKEGRQLAAISMLFQMGPAGVAEFHDMLEAIDRLDWDTAAAEVLDSEFAREDAPGRAKRVAEMFRTGDHPY